MNAEESVLVKWLREVPQRAHKYGLSYRMRPALKALGVDLRPLESTLDGQRMDLLEALEITLVIDGGAHAGEYGRRLRSWGYRAGIVSFEPNPHSYKRLSQAARSDPRWDVFNIGLSDSQDSASLHLHGGVDSPFNSLHALRPTEQATHDVNSGNVSVQLDTLDNLIQSIAAPQQPTLLKLDLQGHEVSALRGSHQTLEACLAVEVEVPTDDALYVDTASTRDQVFGLLHDAGFRAVAIHTERWFGGNPPDMDVLFTRAHSIP